VLAPSATELWELAAPAAMGICSILVCTMSPRPGEHDMAPTAMGIRGQLVCLVPGRRAMPLLGRSLLQGLKTGDPMSFCAPRSTMHAY
jgi:hypothetical protein